jgi:hypothetical protein
VFYPAPAVQDLSPKSLPARLEQGDALVNLELLGYGFRRGAVVFFNNTPLATTYCESDPYCLSMRLYAQIPATYLREAGFARIRVQNPDPSLAASEVVFLRIEALQPTITSVTPGAATVLSMDKEFSIPIVVNGTNFGPQTSVAVYKVGVEPDFDSSAEIVSSTQLYVQLDIEYPDSLGEWKIAVRNPQPGGGISEAVSFFITEANFVPNPFVISANPEAVAAGGPSFTLTVNGTNFRNGSQIRFYSALLPTVFVSNRQLRAEVPASLIQYAGRVPVSVTNPDNGGSSNRIYIEVR